MSELLINDPCKIIPYQKRKNFERFIVREVTDQLVNGAESLVEYDATIDRINSELIFNEPEVDEIS